MSGPELHLYVLAQWRGSTYQVQALGAIIQGASFCRYHDLHPVSLLWTDDKTSGCSGGSRLQMSYKRRK